VIRKIALAALVVPALGAVVGLSFPNGPSPETRPLTGTVAAPENVRPIIARACRDCHTNDTQWPWYSRVPLLSTLIERDVDRGRAHLNFSTSAHDQTHQFTPNQVLEICDAVSDGIMPPRSYKLLHPEARLSKQDIEAFCDWTGVVER
jgi:Haem-binding domain